ncbi:MAG TPA: VWA domain-containing protein [Vicinamibacterales bacterium]|nr:VWA domain-containing protein [Vicinamibacterales bacterium]
MPRDLPRLLLAWLVVSVTLIAQQPPAPAEQPPVQPPSAQPEQPIFRAGAELVRVDVSVTGRNDDPVTDLQAADFVVTEDEIPQTVETVQFVRLDGQRKVDNGESLEIRGTTQALVEAAKDDVRLFAIFLDDYHIDRHPTITIPLRKALEGFVEQLQPTDIVVLMDPLTTLDSLRYTRNKQQLLERIQKFEGRRGELFPVRSAVEEMQLTQRNVWELRAGVSLSALEAIITHFGGIREGRKSVLFVSQGPPVGLPGSVNYPRLEAALQAANRGNVTVHVLDPRPLGSAPFGGAEALRRLSAETGGRAIINTNNPEAGLKDVIADASAYYLIGYAPTRQLSDGKFHKIHVRVKRSGVRVTARRGYWAPTEAESNPEPAAPTDPTLTGALRELVTPGGPDRRVIDIWVGTEPADYGLSKVHVSWEAASRSADTPATVELEPVTRTGASLYPSQTIGSAPKEGAAPTVASFHLKPGPAALKVTLRSPGGSVLDRWTQSLVVPDYASALLKIGTPRVFRTRSLAETRAFDVDPEPTPTASRRFRRTDRLVIDVPYIADAGEPNLGAKLTNRDGKVLAPLTLARGPVGVARVVLPLASLAPSTYTVRVEVNAGNNYGAQVVAFTVSQ